MLRTLRLSHGFSQARLARAIGVSAPYLSQVETGRKPLPAARAVDVAIALGLTGDDRALAVGLLILADTARRP